MSISKVKQVRLETTAEYQPISDLNVRFFNQDINTSVFDFIVTRKNHPIPLGVDNVEGTIVLKSDKFKIQDEVQIKDGMNGIVSYTLPKAILERPGKVTGQIYIGVKGKEDTVVQRLFSFNIADSLINSFDAETKLIYIRKFDQLEEQISQRVESIEQAIEHSEDYITKIVEEKDIALNQIDESKISILEKIEEEKDNLHSIGKTYKENFEQVDVELNQKIEDIKETVKPETYVKHDDTENWQKHKMTQDNGYVQFIKIDNDNNILHSLKSGYYYATLIPGLPDDTSNDGFLTVITRNETLKRLIFMPYDSNKVFMKRFYNTWTEWKELTSNNEQKITTTGWIDLILKNGVEEYPDIKRPQYKIDYINNDTHLYLRGDLTNIKKYNTTVANIPLSKELFQSYNFIQNTSVKNGKAQFARWFITKEGALIMERPSVDESELTGEEWYTITTSLQL
ncbi:MAG TPA: BppU family phage baseplate upper protein [Staphylococcus sp.]|nr:BppU family phage baseplate upper protein [Staphylococcus sp.]